jgi:metal-responsive CopG/Arc/MetJ family transcriptional regulator
MTKTVLYIEEDTLLSLKEMARPQGRNQSTLIREALRSYVTQHERPRPKGIGAYRSGRTDVSERTEELLARHPRPRA